MAQLTHKMGGDSVITNTEAVLFTDGTLQTTAASPQPNTIQAGVAICTSTSASVAFASNYVGSNAPVVVITGLDGFDTHSLFTSVSIVGTAGAWTGFTINVSGTFFGAFNWIAIGNPN